MWFDVLLIIVGWGDEIIVFVKYYLYIDILF